jgi:hypothetical protein
MLGTRAFESLDKHEGYQGHNVVIRTDRRSGLSFKWIYSNGVVFTPTPKGLTTLVRGYHRYTSLWFGILDLLGIKENFVQYHN